MLLLETATEFLDVLGSAELFREYNGGAGLSWKKRGGKKLLPLITVYETIIQKHMQFNEKK
jgi:hypothetical protein